MGKIIVKVFFGHFFIVDKKEWKKIIEYLENYQGDYQDDDKILTLEDFGINTGTCEMDVPEDFEIVSSKPSDETISVIRNLEDTTFLDEVRRHMKQNKK